MIINSDRALKEAVAEIEKLYREHKYLSIDIKKGSQRTPPQNRSLHKYCELLSDELNNAGYTIAKVLTKPLDISWSKHTVKELLWRTVQKAMLDKDSTTKLNRSEVSKVYDELNNIMATRYGITVGFPDAHRDKTA